MKVVLFGAAGYIGKRLLTSLLLNGVDVVPYSSQTAGIFNMESGVLDEAVRISTGTDCVVYLSQSPRYRELPEESSHLWGVNVVSAFRAASLARQSGAKRFIYASTGNVYQPSFDLLNEDSALRRDDWYALSKVHAEEGLALFGGDMSVLSTRIFGVYGPNQADRLVPNLVNAMRAGMPIKLASRADGKNDKGGLRVSLCYVDDAVRIFSQLVCSDATGALNIAGPEVLSIRDMVDAIGGHIGRSPRFEVASQPRPLDLMADITKLVQVCQPQFTSFDDGLRAALDLDGA